MRMGRKLFFYNNSKILRIGLKRGKMKKKMFWAKIKATLSKNLILISSFGVAVWLVLVYRHETQTACIV